MQRTIPLSRSSGRTVAIAAALSVAIGGSAVTVAAQDDLDVLNVAHAANDTTWDPDSSCSSEPPYRADNYEPLI